MELIQAVECVECGRLIKVDSTYLVVDLVLNKNKGNYKTCLSSQKEAVFCGPPCLSEHIQKACNK